MVSKVLGRYGAGVRTRLGIFMKGLGYRGFWVIFKGG